MMQTMGFKMAVLKFQPVRHDPKAFLEKASKRRGFNEAYEALELEYALAHEMLTARTRRAYSGSRRHAHGHHQKCDLAPGVRRQTCALGGFAQALCRGCRMHT